ncbi:MAG: SUMF1/EgtB/PvdO family nonheme iron enzyme [Pseudomonadota bacterium]|nr:SUMF1/EgtB/PvdO family nonheme iron enzyme [Pseudomonadota bacterium]
MSDIFLSYSRDDENRAAGLAGALEALGWSVWWDRTIPAGKTFDEVIEAAIDDARCIIVMWSESSVKSRWVRTEAEEGAHRGVLVPVRIDDVRIPLAFRRIQAADLIEWNGSAESPAFLKLAADIETVLGPSPAREEARRKAEEERESAASKQQAELKRKQDEARSVREEAERREKEKAGRAAEEEIRVGEEKSNGRRAEEDIKSNDEDPHRSKTQRRRANWLPLVALIGVSVAIVLVAFVVLPRMEGTDRPDPQPFAKQRQLQEETDKAAQEAAENEAEAESKRKAQEEKQRRAEEGRRQAKEEGRKAAETKRQADQAVLHGQLDALLAKAQAAFEARRLTSPSDDNALLYYRKVLELDPDHEGANRGIERVHERYLSWAQNAVSNREYGNAERYLERADTVDPGTEAVKSLRNRMLEMKMRDEQERLVKEDETRLAEEESRQPESDKDCEFCPKMVPIPAGEFEMGDLQGKGNTDEQPVRTVRFAKPFALGRYEVTFTEFDRFAKATGIEPPDDEGWGRGDRPVINVTGKDAVAYAEWLSQQTGKRYRLPTEAEWEYAARAGTRTAYWWGNEEGRNRANCDGCGSRWDKKKTAPVGSFPANPFGLSDTAGNVWEWVEDCWHKNYKGAPEDGSKPWRGEDGGNCARRVLRGGSWSFIPRYLRSAYRGRDRPRLRVQRRGVSSGPGPVALFALFFYPLWSCS